MDDHVDYEAYERRCRELRSSTAAEIEVTHADYAPFDLVTVTRLRATNGEPTEWVDLEGLRDGGARDVRVRYLDLWHQMDVHLQRFHGKHVAAPMSPMEFAHATVRAAVTLLMD